MVEITEAASKHILKMLDKNDLPGGGLRVGLRAGGCSGYEYVFAWEQDPKADDQVFVGPQHARIFIDPTEPSSARQRRDSTTTRTW